MKFWFDANPNRIHFENKKQPLSITHVYVGNALLLENFIDHVEKLTLFSVIYILKWIYFNYQFKFSQSDFKGNFLMQIKG